ncbi:MAG: hypothetical protein LBP92_03335 [Deltaproteobacteria bacterium]|nr:hypothetical protein [Deltaproteobacteria bacterium]
MKKFREFYGMAFRSKEFAGEYLGAIKPLPWRDDVHGAIVLMANSDALKIKDMKYLKNLTDYFNRVPCIYQTTPCGPVLVHEIPAVRLKRPTTWWWPDGKNMTGWLGQKKVRWV